ncbi:MAG: deoxyribodipyrimidine photo-lyase, partial [Verrucomicrobiales bacterium]|nr:deoxyribodipyrimidine photo-lyase [Verrucomicrobiales bacterium]
MPLPVVIHWFRRDLRLTDNPALHAAAAAAVQVVPVYALSSWRGQHGWTGPIRQQFLCGSLASLAANLQAMGSRLLVRTGSADEVLEKLVVETGAQAIFFNRDYDPYGRAMEKKIQSLCDRLGIECRSFQDRVMHEPDQILTGDGNPYRVYTPYSRNWLAQEKAQPLPTVKSLGPAAAENIASEALPTLNHWGLPAAPEGVPEAGERAARARMKQLIESDIL